MLIPHTAQIEKAQAKEAGRYAMHLVRFERESPVTKGPALVATNGRILAVVPVEAEEHDADGWISAEALKEARKRAKKSRYLRGARIVANGALAVYDRASNALPERTAEVRNGRTFDPETCSAVEISGPSLVLPAEPDTTTPVATFARPNVDGEFPRYAAVIPHPERPEARISFNPDFLSDLADALGSSSEARAVTLGIAIKGDGSIDRAAPIRVTTSTQGAIGLLMPITIDGEEDPRSDSPARIPLALDRADRALAYALNTLPHKPRDDGERERSERAYNVLRSVMARMAELRAELCPVPQPEEPSTAAAEGA